MGTSNSTCNPTAAACTHATLTVSVAAHSSHTSDRHTHKSPTEQHPLNKDSTLQGPWPHTHVPNRPPDPHLNAKMTATHPRCPAHTLNAATIAYDPCCTIQPCVRQQHSSSPTGRMKPHTHTLQVCSTPIVGASQLSHSRLSRKHTVLRVWHNGRPRPQTTTHTSPRWAQRMQLGPTTAHLR